MNVNLPLQQANSGLNLLLGVIACKKTECRLISTH